MKLLLIFRCAVFLSLQTATAQKLDSTVILSPQASYESYMHKRKVNNTAGWITFGAGIGLMGIGSYIYVREAIESTYDGNGEPLFYLGAASTLASIPLFIAAGKNKGLANLSLKRESVFIGKEIPFKPDYTAIAFTIHF